MERWFIQAKNSHTNKAVTAQCPHAVPVEKLCYDPSGHPRKDVPVYEVPKDDFDLFVGSADDSKLSITAYHQARDGARIIEFQPNAKAHAM